MPRAQLSEEVQIVRFFEEATLEKAEMLFNIVKEKMRSRTAGTANGDAHPPKRRERQSASGEADGAGV